MSSTKSFNPAAAEFVPARKTAKQEKMEAIFSPLAAVNLKSFAFPFSFINSRYGDKPFDYKPADFCRGFPDEAPCDVGDFPNNIAECYWVHNGEKDEEAWHLLCRLKNGCYVYYTASCDYTGFDCQGYMKMYISRNADRIFYEAMERVARESCLSEKVYKKKSKTHFAYREWNQNFGDFADFAKR